ncbi:MAG: SDR family NAD(P)-dependent oxidoreductase, partial [Micromonosporaceae bacterium]
RHWVEPPAAGASPATAGWAAADDVEGKLPMPQWFWVPLWRQTRRPTPMEAAAADGPWLVLRDPGGFVDPLVSRLRDSGVDVVTVTPAGGPADDAGHVVRPDQVEDYERLLDELAARGTIPTRVIHAWTSGAGGVDPLDPAAARATLPMAFGSLIAIAQAYAGRDLAGSLDITVLSSGSQDVTGGDLHSPARALVNGPLRVLPLEFPGLRCRQIDVDGEVVDPDLVLEELTNPSIPVVAYRRGKRWAPAFDPAELEPAAAQRAGLREGGTYVITGGLGGIGLSIAEDLARRVHARLVLVGRSSVADRAEWPLLAGVPGKAGRQARALLRIEQLGGQLFVLAADVRDPEQARRVRVATMETFGAVHGVIHAAGVAGGTMVEVQSEQTAAAVLEPKVFGTLALVDAFRDDPLDFLMLCSSVTALAGGLGQVDYCAANGFLDAFARSRCAPWPVISVNWGGWLEVGMAAEAMAPAAFREFQQGTHQEPVDHPLLDVVRTREGSRRVTCVVRLAADTHWVLDEHRIAGVPAMPGTGYLEMVRAAFSLAQPGRPVELQDVVFLAPLAVPDGTGCELRITFDDGVDGGEFHVESWLGTGQQEHARGFVRWAAPGGCPAIDLDAVRLRCAASTRTASMQESASGLLTFGPRWSSLREAYTGDGEELALLAAGDTVSAELANYGLHPAMLDEATAFGAFGGAQGHYLPLGYGRLVVHRPMSAQVFSHLRHRDTGTPELLTCDITLTDEHGGVLVEINDFMLRRIDADGISTTLRQADGGGTESPLGVELVPVAEPVPPEPARASEDDAEVGIRPAEGGEAFARLLGARVGPQVAVTALHLPTLISKVQRRNRSRLTEELGDRVLADGAGSQVLSGPYVAPRNQVEQQLVQLWEESTGAVGVGVEHNFFDIGGNSLVAAQLVARVRTTFGVKLPMRVIFESPTIAGMAAMIEASAQATG